MPANNTAPAPQASSSAPLSLDPDNFADYQNTLFEALMDTTRATQFLNPAELDFYKASSPGFDSRLQNAGDRILVLCNKLIAHAADSSASGRRALAKRDAAGFGNDEDLVERFDEVVDVVDNLLEMADVNLDEVTGRLLKTAPKLPPTQSAMVLQVASRSGGPRSSVNVIHSANIQRPQLHFEDRIDNSNRPFVRRITHKPNAKRPLDYGLPGSDDISPEMRSHLETLRISDVASSQYSLPHPYEYEIQNIDYPKHMFAIRPEQLYDTMDKTPFTWVDTEEKLNELAKILDGVNEIAIDLEVGNSG
ncbi:NUC016 domain-containing protein [Blyttiomyces helicus]|uniref:NUC016 domain-containing protein n=1 Tax=Blyttiomyces helicus TaxID=388810 RepID=A0A4P9WGS6_9FUNG|nr:NUC016 domain-containing protein [Blyttiomyces helicus]|eukprot:RKO89706.1 NUC016 domain-containing protein [Blyttiomyces helicus]